MGPRSTSSCVLAVAGLLVASCGGGGSSVSPPKNDVAPVIAYSSLAYSFSTGVTTLGITPSASGGKVVSWSIAPALPSGLTFGPTDGSIAGTPTAPAAAAPYVVTASNSGGQAVANLMIAVSPGPILDLGLGHFPLVLRLDSAHVFGQDEFGHWILWSFPTGAEIASGKINCEPGFCSVISDYAGPTIVVATPAGLELRSSVDGSLLTSIATTPAWWRLASDGSYVCAGSTTGLMVWSPSGQVLASRQGDYSGAAVFAMPGMVLVALGPAGQNVVETISIATGQSSVGPAYQGTFSSWFFDGGRFLTVDSTTNTVRVYSNANALQDTRPLPAFAQLGGSGSWFWTVAPLGSTVSIYAVGSSSLPAASYGLTVSSILSPSGTTLAILNLDASPVVSIIDLSGAAPSKVDYTPPMQFARSYAATSSSQWVVANGFGVLLDGSLLPASSRLFDYGQATSIAGGAGHYAIATASGTILYFNSATNVLEGQINYSSSNLAVSSDGTLLAVQADPTLGAVSTDRSTRIYSLPSATLLTTFPFTTTSSPTLVDMTISASGAVLGEYLINPASQQTTPVAGGPATIIPGSGGDQFLRLSPDGTRTAVSNFPAETRGTATTTNTYLNGTLTSSLTGWAAGWIDNGRLLVNNYETNHGSYVGASLYGPSGTPLGSPPIPELLTFQVVTPQLPQPDLLYTPGTNTIISLSSGATQWASGSPSEGFGAVAGSQIVFVSGDRVLAEPH